jgi:hypothetical protein
VGNITKVDGAAITPAKSALGKTNAAGVSSIVIYSEETGKTYVQAVATYPENPYPQMLIDRSDVNPSTWIISDWEPQPSLYAKAVKTWIPHVIGGDSNAPITPAYAVNNTGEVEQFTLTLKDVYGNAIPGYTVLWWIQGVGQFKTDDSSWAGIGEQNKDWDITDSAGKADVWVKSLVPGQTIIHCKVVDKYGLPYKEWNVVKQWYSIDQVQLGTISSTGVITSTATNPVNTPHTWTAVVSGAKYVHVLYDINGNGLTDDQALLATKAGLQAAVGSVAVMSGNMLTWAPKAAATAVLPGQVFRYGNGDTVAYRYYTCYADITLATAEFWKDGNADSIPEVWSALAGKNVYFYTNIGSGQAPTSNTPVAGLVGTITSATQATTDANGKATVTINSTNQGLQWTYVVADYTDNPQDGNPLVPVAWAQLRYATALKTWTPAAPSTVKVFEAGATNVEGNRWVNPVTAGTNSATIAVQVFDQYGNALPGYKVTYEIIGQGTKDTAQTATYHPYAHFANPAQTPTFVGDLNPNTNVNPFVGTVANGTPNLNVPDTLDADYAWGTTLDTSINFKLESAYAAHVDLVLDETLGQLQAGGVSGAAGITHFTNIVNIKVFTPAGALYQQFEVTKVWDISAPGQAVALTLGLGTAATGPFGASLTTNTTPLYYSIALTDATGGIGTATNLKIRVAGPVAASVIVAAAPAGGVSTASFAAPTVAGTYTLTAWVDTDNDGIIDAGEIQAAPATLVIN